MMQAKPERLKVRLNAFHVVLDIIDAAILHDSHLTHEQETHDLFMKLSKNKTIKNYFQSLK